MARIRTVKPEFFTSDTITELSLRARLTFVGLWTHCDDHGRCRDNAKLIKAAVWPLDDVSIKDVEIDLNTLADRGLIIRYEAGGKALLQVASWDEHQAAAYRRGEAKHPAPSAVQDRAGCTTERATDTQIRAGTGNREQGTGTHARAPDNPPPSEPDPGFTEFWKLWPRKESRKAAEKAWDKLKPLDRAAALQALPNHIKQWTNVDTKFIPHAATWLNGHRWEDQIEHQPAADATVKRNGVQVSKRNAGSW